MMRRFQENDIADDAQTKDEGRSLKECEKEEMAFERKEDIAMTRDDGEGDSKEDGNVMP